MTGTANTTIRIPANTITAGTITSGVITVETPPFQPKRKGLPMSTEVPPALLAEIAAIFTSDDGEAARYLVGKAETSGAGATDAERLAAKLAGIAMVPAAYRRFDKRLTEVWRNSSNLTYPPDGFANEVIVGAGWYAAVIAALRHLGGHPKPIVIDPAEPGGSFAVSQNPSFYLNSECTPGGPGAPWDRGLNDLNWMPGAPVQAAQISGREIPDNTVPRFVVRAALALHARIIRSKVTAVQPVQGLLRVTLLNGRAFYARRVYDARGIGPETDTKACDGKTILSWSQAMSLADNPGVPFRGSQRIAVVGNGKSAYCAAETALGIGPPMGWRAAADFPVRVDLYAPGAPVTREKWLSNVQPRYSRLGSHLASEANPFLAHDLYVIGEAGNAVPVPGGVLVNGRLYDQVVMCTGHTAPSPLISDEGFDLIKRGGRYVARKVPGRQYYLVGPLSQIPWENPEVETGLSANPDNIVALNRYTPRVATLASQLPAPADGT
jgi:hypothetical protein